MDWTIGLLDYISSYFWTISLDLFFGSIFGPFYGVGGGGQTSSAWGREGPEIPWSLSFDKINDVKKIAKFRGSAMGSC